MDITWCYCWLISASLSDAIFVLSGWFIWVYCCGSSAMHRTAEFVLIGQYLRNCCPLIQAQHLYYWETFFLDPRVFVSHFKSFIFLLFLALLFKILRSPARLRLSFFLYLFGFPFKPSIHPVSIKPLITILKFLFLALSKPINTGLKTQVEFCANNPLSISFPLVTRRSFSVWLPNTC